jgi:hypothetical protein
MKNAIAQILLNINLKIIKMDWKQRKIYAVPFDSFNMEIEGSYLPYYYLHGEAENLNGYDICNANDKAFTKALKQGAFLCMIVFTDGTEREGICFSKYNMINRMEGLVCLLEDDEHIEHAVKQYMEFKHTPSMYTDEEDYMKEIGKFNLIKILN